MFFRNRDYKNITIDNERFTYWDSGDILAIEKVNSVGQFHSDDGSPAVFIYDLKGNIREKIFGINDKIHRIGAPALIRYDVSGRLYLETWFIDGVECRNDVGPTTIMYRYNNKTEQVHDFTYSWRNVNGKNSAMERHENVNKNKQYIPPCSIDQILISNW